MTPQAVRKDVRPDRAWMDVRKGRTWTGARLPVDLALEDGSLVLTVGTIRLQKKERAALVRFCGDEVLSTLIAKRQPPQIALALADTGFEYPSFPGLGRTTIRIDAPQRPPAVLTFADPEALGNPMANPWGFTARVLRSGPAARRARDGWKAAIEETAAPTR